MEKIQGYCIGLLKEWMDFDMTWPKWFLMSSELYELSDKNAKYRCFLLAEVYNTKEYRNYSVRKMDYLYDKVETYDKLKEVIQGKSTPDGLSDIQQSMKDIESYVALFRESRRATFG
jgi:lysozyme family protein